MAQGLRIIVMASALAATCAAPAAAISVPEPAPRAASAAELMRGQPPVAAPSETPFDTAIASYHATAAWMGIPEKLDAVPFLLGFLKGAALLLAILAVSQRRLLFGGPRRRP